MFKTQVIVAVMRKAHKRLDHCLRTQGPAHVADAGAGCCKCGGI